MAFSVHFAYDVCRPDTSQRQQRRLPPYPLDIALVPLKCSCRNLSFPQRVPFIEEKIPWWPCPFKIKAYRKVCISIIILPPRWHRNGVNALIPSKTKTSSNSSKTKLTSAQAKQVQSLKFSLTPPAWESQYYAQIFNAFWKSGQKTLHLEGSSVMS